VDKWQAYRRNTGFETRIYLKNRLNSVIHGLIPPKDTKTTASKIHYPAHSGFINNEMKPELSCRANTDM
jgi:hypothetical protein